MYHSSVGEMDYKQVEKRMNDEIDRLSNLPDDLIHKVLSFVGIKCAIETSALSSRWRYIWTSMPYLDFLVEDFSTPPKLSQFVTQVLSRRNNLVEVFSIKLRFRGYFSQEFVKQLLNYAFSHNIRQLDITWLYEEGIQYPLSLICSRSLTHLSLRKKYVYRTDKGYGFTSTSTLKLPVLTSLYLEDVIFWCDDDSDKCSIFSECANLKILTLKGCKVKGFSHLNICLPLLSNLTLDVHGELNSVNMIAPQLMNLTIRNMYDKYQYVISAPNLVSLCYTSYLYPLHLSTEGFHSLEKVELCVTRSRVSAQKMVCLFQQLRRVKYLTLNMEILEFLSSSVEVISNQPSPFANLKSLHVYPVEDLSEVQNDVEMSSEVKNYFLEKSPSATFTVVSREEIWVKKEAELAQNQMARLRVRLEDEKAKVETSITRVENLLHIGGRMTNVNRCWEGLNKQIEQGRAKTDDIISELKNIRYDLTKLPISKRAEMQACFSSLCSEANNVVNKIMDLVKIICDLKGSRFCVYFDELATILEPSS